MRRVVHKVRILRDPLPLRDAVPHLLAVPVDARAALRDRLLRDGDGDLEMGDLETEKCGDGPANIIEGRRRPLVTVTTFHANPFVQGFDFAWSAATVRPTSWRAASASVWCACVTSRVSCLDLISD